ncbi:MAG: SCO family protein [Bacteroidales bacterium]|nr:SCO family protein [Bacteroidales bacterium]
MKRILPSILTFSLLIIWHISAGQYEVPKQEEPSQELGIYEQLDRVIDGDIVLFDETGNPVRFDELVKKPTALSLVYYKCPGICTILMNGVSDAVKQTEMVLGTEYDVLTVSFAPAENYEVASEKKQHYAKINSSQDIEHGWRFLTGDSANIARLLNQTGFKVKKVGDQYIHPGALIVLSPERKITRYLNGEYYNPFDLKLALIEAAAGRSGPTINKVLNYCFSYDPEGKKYVFNITKVAGSAIIFLAALLLSSMIILERKRKKNIQKNQIN